jgi:hypothetical protein
LKASARTPKVDGVHRPLAMKKYPPNWTIREALRSWKVVSVIATSPTGSATCSARRVTGSVTVDIG